VLISLDRRVRQVVPENVAKARALPRHGERPTLAQTYPVSLPASGEYHYITLFLDAIVVAR
jgi:hypothetical protein